MTVFELIEALKKFPGDAEVAISDADTGWNLSVKKVEFEDCTSNSGVSKPNTVFLWGEYGEEV